MKRCLSIILAAFISCSASFAQAPTSRSAMSFLGAYSSSVIYTKNDVVTEGSSAYISLALNNTGNDPHTENASGGPGVHWAILGSQGTQGTPGASGATPVQLGNTAAVPTLDFYNALGMGQRNLFNPTGYTPVNADISATDGTLITGIGNYMFATPFLPVAGVTSIIAPEDMVATGSAGVVCFDVNKAFLSAVATGRVNAGTALSLPSGCAYLRTSFLNTYTALYTGNALPSSPIPYGYVYPDASRVSGLFSATLPLIQTSLADAAQEPFTLAPLTRNLFDANRATIIPAGSVTGPIYDSLAQTIRGESCCASWSGLIPVVPGQQYTISNQPVVNNNPSLGGVFFDANQAPIPASFFPVTSTYPLTLTAPSNAAFIGFPISKLTGKLGGCPAGTTDPNLCDTSGNPTALQSVMLTQGATAPSVYVPFSPLPSPAMVIPGSLNTNYFSPWAGKSVSIIGDSYCYGDQWQYALAAYHQMKIKLQDCRVGRQFNAATECYGGSWTGTNTGSSVVSSVGAACNSIANYSGQLYSNTLQVNNGTPGNTLAQDLAGSDLILVELGTNDNYDPALGTIADGPTVASTYGYLQAFEQGLHSIIPATTRVVFITPIQVSSTAGNRAAMMAPVTAAIQAVAALYGDTVIDNLHNSPFNALSDPTLLQSDGIHPLAVPVFTGGPTGFQLFSRYPTLQLNGIPPFD